jgi:hypothetical protein
MNSPSVLASLGTAFALSSDNYRPTIAMTAESELVNSILLTGHPACCSEVKVGSKYPTLLPKGAN